MLAGGQPGLAGLQPRPCHSSPAAFAIADLRELLHQLDEDRTGAGRVLADEDPEPAAMELWSLSFSAAGEYVIAEGLWNIWGRITDESHPNGSEAEARRLAIPAAEELRSVIGDEA